MGELMETILHRRAIRRYETRQIAEDALQQILQAGLYAPSAGGRQGPLLVVSQDRTVNQRWGELSGQIPTPVWQPPPVMYPKSSPALPMIPICATRFMMRPP